jgi:hypothetical protein
MLWIVIPIRSDLKHFGKVGIRSEKLFRIQFRDRIGGPDLYALKICKI